MKLVGYEGGGGPERIWGRGQNMIKCIIEHSENITNM